MAALEIFQLSENVNTRVHKRSLDQKGNPHYRLSLSLCVNCLEFHLMENVKSWIHAFKYFKRWKKSESLVRWTSMALLQIHRWAISYNRVSVSSAYGNNIIITGKDWHRLKENIVHCNSLDHVHMVVAIVVQFCQRVK